MSTKANPTVIGIFIAAGLALGVVGVLIFSSSRLFTPSVRFVIYFDTSLTGLQEGAPVRYRGVTVGSVYRVMIHFQQDASDTAMPVIIELRDRLIRERIIGATRYEDLQNINEQVRHGLRATLETESIVTGVLYISLEIHGDAPPAVYRQKGNTYQEIPSMPTDIQQLMKNIARMDLAGLENKISSLITRIDQVVSELNLRELSAHLNDLLHSASRVVNSPDLTNSLASLKRTLDQFQSLAQNVNHHLDPVAAGFTNTLAQANTALQAIRGGIEDLRDVVAPESALRQDLTLTLDQLTGAAVSLSDLAQYLRYHPNALITGRAAEKKP